MGRIWLPAGGGDVDMDMITAIAEDVLSEKVIVDKDGNPLVGTMPNIGAITKSLNCGGSYTVPKGYHDGSGKVTANSLSSQTSATATAAKIRSGKTGWVNGTKITGTAKDKAAATYTPGTSNQTIASGQILTGAQTIAGDADLISANILRGKNIFNVPGATNVLKYISGSKATGSSTVNTNGNPNYFNFPYYDINPGFTPVFAISRRDNGRVHCFRNSADKMYYVSDESGSVAGWQKFSSGTLPFTKTCVRLCGRYAGVTQYYWIFGY